MAKISLTKIFPPTTTTVLEINEIGRESDKVQFGLSFKTNLGSSQSYVGTGITYNATLKVSGAGIETQTKSVQLKTSSDYWQGTATHTLNKLSWEVNVPSSANSVLVEVTYKYSDESTTMSGSTEITLTKLLNVLNPFSNNESLDLEQAQTLSITQYDSAFTSNLELIVKNNQNQNVTIANFENVENGQQILLNETQLNTLFNATSNQQKYQIFWLLYTLSSGTSIGNTTTQSIGIINNANPIFTDFDFADINPITTAVTSSNQSIVGGVSTLQITIPTTKKATAVKGASIVSYIISDKAIDYSDSEITKTISQYNSSKIVVSAVDTRGNTTTVQKTITDFIVYNPIAINQTSATISRTNNIDEETKISFEGTFWNNNFGKVDNALSIAYKYRLKGSSETYTTGVTTITPTISNNSFSVTDKAILGDTNNGFDVSKSYEIIVEVSDKLSVNEIDYTLNPGKNAIEIVGNEVVKINDIPFDEIISKGESVLGEILFENETGNNGNITLNSDTSNYKYIEVFYKDNNDRYGGYTKVYNPNGKNIDIDMVEALNSNNGYIRRTRYLISGTEMTLSNKGYIRFEGTNTIKYDTATNYIYIYKVVGYKLNSTPIETQSSEVVLYSNKIYSDTEINLDTNEYKRLLVTCAIYDNSNVNTGGASNIIMLDLETKGSGTTNYIATNSFAYISSNFTTANALMQVAIVVNADKTKFKPVFFYNANKITSSQTNYYVSKIIGIKK